MLFRSGVQRPTVVLDDVSFVCLMDVVLRDHCHGINRASMNDVVEVAEDKGGGIEHFKNIEMLYCIYQDAVMEKSVLAK